MTSQLDRQCRCQCQICAAVPLSTDDAVLNPYAARFFDRCWCRGWDAVSPEQTMKLAPIAAAPQYIDAGNVRAGTSRLDTWHFSRPQMREARRRSCISVNDVPYPCGSQREALVVAFPALTSDVRPSSLVGPHLADNSQSDFGVPAEKADLVKMPRVAHPRDWPIAASSRLWTPKGKTSRRCRLRPSSGHSGGQFGSQLRTPIQVATECFQCQQFAA